MKANPVPGVHDSSCHKMNDCPAWKGPEGAILPQEAG